MDNKKEIDRLNWQHQYIRMPKLSRMSLEEKRRILDEKFKLLEESSEESSITAEKSMGKIKT